MPLPSQSSIASAWEFDNNYGDSRGIYDLTPSGSPTFVAGLRGLGLNLVGASSQHAAVAAYPPLRNLSRFSVELAWKPAALSDFRTLFGWQTGATASERVVIFNSGAGLSDNNELGCSVSTGVEYNAWVNADNDLTIGSWTHIVMTFNGTFVSGDVAVQNANRLALYANGVQRVLAFTGGATVPTTTSNSADHPLAIGRAGTGTSYPTGVFDICRIWTGVTLTAGNVTTLYNSGLAQTLASAKGSSKTRMGVGLGVGF
jgi:hypothetical protein